MLSKQEEVIRVGVWVVVVAAVVGLIVLLLAGSARSQELSQPEDLAHWLVSDTPPSAAERLEEAESLLREDRRRRMTSLHIGVVETVWQLFSQASPKRLLKSGQRILRAVRQWGERQPSYGCPPSSCARLATHRIRLSGCNGGVRHARSCDGDHRDRSLGSRSRHADAGGCRDAGGECGKKFRCCGGDGVGQRRDTPSGSTSCALVRRC